MTEEEKQTQLLENFVLNNENLEKLESKISGFNIFEAIGMRHQEIRHSKTLAYLLDPHNQHGLGQQFLKKILMNIVIDQKTKVSPIDVDFADLSDAKVLCEWKNIDILIVCPTAELVVAVENKIHAQESENQLSDYKKTIEREFPREKFRPVYVFLTIDGDEPEKKENRLNWLCYSHMDLVDLLESIYNSNQRNLGVDQSVLIRHYIELMRRHILEDGEIPELARKIYESHKQAIDLIFEHRPDFLMENASCLKILVEKNKGFELLHSTKTYIRFRYKSWTFSEDWASRKSQFKDAGVLFEFENRGNKIKLVLLVTDINNQEKKNLLLNTISEKLGREPGRLGHWPRAWVFEKKLEISEDDQLDRDAFEKEISRWFHIFLSEHLEGCAVAVNEAIAELNINVAGCHPVENVV